MLRSQNESKHRQEVVNHLAIDGSRIPYMILVFQKLKNGKAKLDFLTSDRNGLIFSSWV